MERISLRMDTTFLLAAIASLKRSACSVESDEVTVFALTFVVHLQLPG
jgi:hypothetical protein